jgi:hypothetical protein
MTEFLKKLKLIQPFSLSLNVTKQKFVSELSKITEPSELRVFSGYFEIFNSNNKEFKGKVSSSGFKIRRKFKMFDAKNTAAIAEGNYNEKEDRLIIEGTINGFHNFFYIYYGFLIIFYSIFIINTIMNDDITIFIFPFISLHGLAMFIIPYFVIRRSVNRLKYELEREFFYLTK